MIFKIKGFFLITFLILLQSCSGGKIGNFLESSFDNLEKNENKKNNNKKKNKIPETFSVDKKVSSLENRENKINNNKQKNNKQKNNKQKNKIQENIYEGEGISELDKKDKKKRNIQLEKIDKTKILNKKNLKKKNKKENQSYKIIFILKDVDPKDPIEQLSTILRNSELNFEIEKIERFLESK